MKILTLTAALVFTIAAGAFAHSGGTDGYGCHTDHKTGIYHCH